MEKAEIGKLRWRCIRRALLELDIALSRFLDEQFDLLSEEEQKLFAELADWEDHDLWQVISGQAECEDDRLAPIVAMLRKGSVSNLS